MSSSSALDPASEDPQLSVDIRQVQHLGHDLAEVLPHFKGGSHEVLFSKISEEHLLPLPHVSGSVLFVRPTSSAPEKKRPRVCEVVAVLPRSSDPAIDDLIEMEVNILPFLEGGSTRQAFADTEVRVMTMDGFAAFADNGGFPFPILIASALQQIVEDRLTARLALKRSRGLDFFEPPTRGLLPPTAAPISVSALVPVIAPSEARNSPPPSGAAAPNWPPPEYLASLVAAASSAIKASALGGSGPSAAVSAPAVLATRLQPRPLSPVW